MSVVDVHYDHKKRTRALDQVPEGTLFINFKGKTLFLRLGCLSGIDGILYANLSSGIIYNTLETTRRVYMLDPTTTVTLRNLT